MAKGPSKAPSSTAPSGAVMNQDTLANLQALSVELRVHLDQVSKHRLVLFSAPAVTESDVTARATVAQLVANSAGLLPWPDWTVVRHGAGSGAHLLNVLFDLGETGRAEAVVVCPLAPLDPCLIDHARALANAHHLELVVLSPKEVTSP